MTTPNLHRAGVAAALKASKVPAATLGFWIVKVLATTLGETGGDTLSMTLDLGYLRATAIFGIALIGLASAQVAARRFRPALYWATIIASTTAGTTLADFATRSIGIGYPGGALMLFALVIAALAAWRLTLGRIAADHIDYRAAEAFYWLTITLSQTLGTALGDWLADTGGLGYLGAASVFAAGLILVILLYRMTGISRVLLFWTALILTRPLGAAVGDLLDKPIGEGGLNFSRPWASALLVVAIVALVRLMPQRTSLISEPMIDPAGE